MAVARDSGIPFASLKPAAARDRTLLLAATREGNPEAKELFDLLMSIGVDFSVKDDTGSNVLHRLCNHKRIDPDMIRLAIAAGADADAVDGDGRSVLHCLLYPYSVPLYSIGPTEMTRRVMMIETLVAAGADINIKDRCGKTPLFQLCEPPFSGGATVEPAIRELVRLGADVRATDHNGTTALHSLAQFNRTALLELLIDNGADVNARDDDGHTPLFWAHARDPLEPVPVALLISRGADADACDFEGWKLIAHAFWYFSLKKHVNDLLPHTTDVFSHLVHTGPRSVAECRSRARLYDVSEAEADGFVSTENLVAQHMAKMNIPVLEGLFEDRPIPADHRRLLKEAVTTFVGVAVLEEVRAAVVARRAQAELGDGEADKANEAAAANTVTELKLKPLKDDAWDRRKLLVHRYFETRRIWREGGAPKNT